MVRKACNRLEFGERPGRDHPLVKPIESKFKFFLREFLSKISTPRILCLETELRTGMVSQQDDIGHFPPMYCYSIEEKSAEHQANQVISKIWNAIDIADDGKFLSDGSFVLLNNRALSFDSSDFVAEVRVKDTLWYSGDNYEITITTLDKSRTFEAFQRVIHKLQNIISSSERAFVARKPSNGFVIEDLEHIEAYMTIIASSRPWAGRKDFEDRRKCVAGQYSYRLLWDLHHHENDCKVFAQDESLVHYWTMSTAKTMLAAAQALKLELFEGNKDKAVFALIDAQCERLRPSECIIRRILSMYNEKDTRRQLLLNLCAEARSVASMYEKCARIVYRKAAEAQPARVNPEKQFNLLTADTYFLWAVFLGQADATNTPNTIKWLEHCIEQYKTLIRVFEDRQKGDSWEAVKQRVLKLEAESVINLFAARLEEDFISTRFLVEFIRPCGMGPDNTLKAMSVLLTTAKNFVFE